MHASLFTYLQLNMYSLKKKVCSFSFLLIFLLSWEGILYFFGVGIILLIGFGIIPHSSMIVWLSATRFSCVAHCLVSFFLTLVFVKIDYDNLVLMLCWVVLRLFYGWKKIKTLMQLACVVKARAKVIVSWWVELNQLTHFFWVFHFHCVTLLNIINFVCLEY